MLRWRADGTIKLCRQINLGGSKIKELTESPDLTHQTTAAWVWNCSTCTVTSKNTWCYFSFTKWATFYTHIYLQWDIWIHITPSLVQQILQIRQVLLLAALLASWTRWLHLSYALPHLWKKKTSPNVLGSGVTSLYSSHPHGELLVVELPGQHRGTHQSMRYWISETEIPFYFELPGVLSKNETITLKGLGAARACGHNKCLWSIMDFFFFF